MIGVPISCLFTINVCLAYSVFNSVLNVVVAAFNQEKALVGAFSVITNLRMDLFEALMDIWAEMAAIAMMEGR